MAKTSFVANPAKIKVIGLGGGGCNAVTRMVQEEIRGVEFIAMNTDAQALAITEAPTRVQLGEKLTKGLGVGGDYILGQKSAEENRDDIKEIVSGEPVAQVYKVVSSEIVGLVVLCAAIVVMIVGSLLFPDTRLNDYHAEREES